MTTLTRRRFLQSTAATGMALLVGIDANSRLATALESAPVSATALNPFLRIGADGTVTVIAKHFEMGQGISTGLATLVAEELDADWTQVKVDFAPADNSRYANKLLGVQGTGGSTAIASSFTLYRQAGAAARDLMVRAAAEQWGVPAEAISIDQGVVSHGDQRAGFADLVATASTYTPLEDPTLKQPEHFKLIGKDLLPRTDSASKTDGTAEFAIDVKLPGMLYATVLRSPRAGGTVASFDAGSAQDIPGFVDAKVLPTGAGIVVYARDTWTSMKARGLLDVEWNDDEADRRSTDELIQSHRATLDNDPAYQVTPTAAEDAERAIAGAAKTVEAEFTLPNLAHAPMEPLNCVIEPTENGVRLHDGCQIPGLVQGVLASVLSLPPENVEIRTVYAGGSFGRRATAECDYQVEAAMAYQLMDGQHPIKLIWSREDDLGSGYYRPLSTQRIAAALDGENKLAGWHHRIVGQSIIKGTPFEGALVRDGVDHSSVEGIADTLYGIPAMAVGLTDYEAPRKALWWRAVGHTQNAFVMESMIDMLALEAGQDPVAFRLALLEGGDEKQQRMADVIALAAERSGWAERKPGEGWGFASHSSFNSYVAEVAKVSMVDGNISVDRFTCAVDCGVAVNPDVIRAQMEGSVGYGIGAMMRNQITYQDGLVQQSNFPDYEPLRLSDMPQVDVHLVSSAQAPSGVGEPGVPPAGPALANAIFDLTGQRLTTMPMSANGVSFA